MKKIVKILTLSVLAAALFVGCKPTETPTETPTNPDTNNGGSDTPVTTPADDGNKDNNDPNVTPPADDPTDEEPTPTYTTIWTGSCELAWDGGQEISHENFTADVKGVKISYSSANGEYSSIKIAVCEPWGDIIPTSAKGGTVKNDGAISVEINKTDVTLEIYFDEANAKKIVGENKDGAWGGLKVYGFGATITKVESIK